MAGLQGSCLCGAVRYTADGDIGAPTACHCKQCRKSSGHFWASAWVEDSGLHVTGNVQWYQSSDVAKRGFCPICGSALFWKHDSDPFTCFGAGTVDGDIHQPLVKHIHTATKGDYYEIADNAPQRET
ncbi:MAG: GFA family protein [Pseudomonadota bacterium]